ncbi:unnamed protein product [Protopolystoma xenopodis]|uniref:Uncharacterized protein n=1 Tax=Protopolystoma xenopodis TaxID=117903 RepID=A0A3S5B9E8_9PLAT|nr:unnamed protein product [Protopolystoma xenopodis]
MDLGVSGFILLALGGALLFICLVACLYRLLLSLRQRHCKPTACWSTESPPADQLSPTVDLPTEGSRHDGETTSLLSLEDDHSTALHKQTFSLPTFRPKNINSGRSVGDKVSQPPLKLVTRKGTSATRQPLQQTSGGLLSASQVSELTSNLASLETLAGPTRRPKECQTVVHPWPQPQLQHHNRNYNHQKQHQQYHYQEKVSRAGWESSYRPDRQSIQQGSGFCENQSTRRKKQRSTLQRQQQHLLQLPIETRLCEQEKIIHVPMTLEKEVRSHFLHCGSLKASILFAQNVTSTGAIGSSWQ